MNDAWAISQTWQLISLLVVAGSLHAGFQVAISVLTGLSVRHFGFGRPHAALLMHSGAYVAGVAAATVALLFSLLYLVTLTNHSSLLWAAITGYGVAVGIIVMFVYYRSGPGTMLWLPRGVAAFLETRIKKTDTSIESFSLGIMTVVAELPFVLAPLLIAAMVLSGQVNILHVTGVVIYGLIGVVPLLIIIALIGGGRKLSTIQRWREANKGFLQFASGLGLIVISLYAFVNYCLGSP